jgi:hypothetical protein
MKTSVTCGTGEIQRTAGRPDRGTGSIRRLVVAAAATGLASAILFPPSVLAAPDWSRPTLLGLGLHPSIAVDASGEAVAVWEEIPAPDSASPQATVESASRPPGGTWSQPTTISAPGLVSGRMSPQVAISPGGEAVAVWGTNRGPNRLESASRPPDGGWTPPTVITRQPHRLGGYEQQVAIDRSGDAIAVWHGFSHGHNVVASASRAPGGVWSHPRRLSGFLADSSFRPRPRIAIASSGEAVAVWGTYVLVAREYTEYPTIERAVRSPAGTWSRPEILTRYRREGCSEADVAMNPQGDALAVWACGGEGEAPTIRSVSRPAAGGWSRARTISAGPRPVAYGVPKIAVDVAGEAVAVWRERRRGVSAVIQSATRPPAGHWSAPVNLSATGFAIEPRVGCDDAGQMAALWATSNDSKGFFGQFRIKGALRSAPTAPWLISPTFSSSDVRHPEIAVAADGEAIGAWERCGASKCVVEATSGLEGSP